MAYVISKDDCLGCGACKFACPFDIPEYHQDGNIYQIPEDKCVGCGECQDICPVSAIAPGPGQKKIRLVKIIEDKCIGCSLCAKNCPNNAISGVIKSPYVIDPKKCILCGYCATKCKKEAIEVSYYA